MHKGEAKAEMGYPGPTHGSNDLTSATYCTVIVVTSQFKRSNIIISSSRTLLFAVS